MAVWVRASRSASGWPAGHEPASEGGHALFAARRCAPNGTLLAAGKTAPHLRWTLRSVAFSAAADDGKGKGGVQCGAEESEDMSGTPYEILAGAAPGYALVWTAVAAGAPVPDGAVVLGVVAAPAPAALKKRGRAGGEAVEGDGAGEPLYVAQVSESGRVTPGWYSHRAGTAAYGFGWRAHAVTDRSKFRVLCVQRTTADAETPLAALGLRRMDVPATVGIRAFMQSHGLDFARGTSFYELTKRENIAPTKEVLVENKTNGVVVDGRRAREVLQLPSGETCTLSPASIQPNLRVYVESTSYNRNLVAGTTLLYRGPRAATADEEAALPAAKRARPNDAVSRPVATVYSLEGNPAHPGQGRLILGRPPTTTATMVAASQWVRGHVYVYSEPYLNSVVARFYSDPLPADVRVPAQAGAFALTIWCRQAATSNRLRLLFNVVETADTAFTDPVYVATTVNAQAVPVPAGGQAGPVTIAAAVAEAEAVLRKGRRVCVEVRGHGGGQLELGTGGEYGSWLGVRNEVSQ